MSTDKFHYYDGELYEKLIDPVLKEIRTIVTKQIKVNSKVIDICCGTGALVFDLAKHCKTITGIELSSKMIARAKHRTQIENIKNINFIHGDATNLLNIKNHQFDYAVISMALHEISPKLREKVLLEAKRIAKKIIIADYSTPQPLNFAKLIIHIIELLAGTQHFKCFRNFQKNNGINQLLINCKISICNETTNKFNTIKVVVAQ